MIIVVPVSSTDDEVVDDFIKVFNLFGPYENHDLVVVNRPADIKEGRRVYRALAHNNFKSKTHWTFDEDGRRSWPGGPNHYWVETINFLAEEYDGNRHQPWLWLEMDMTPIKKGWADILQKGYNKCGKPFMGNLEWTTTTTSEREMVKLCQHLVGAAIYPPASDMDKYSKIWSKVNKVNTAWDVILQWELPQHAHDTKLIQCLFRTGNYQRIKSDTGRWIVQGEDREPWPDPNYTFSKPVDIKNAVIVHGCNDGSLARMVCEDVTGEKTIDELSKDITYDTSKDKVSKRKLPVFFHVPKCAGTYTYNTMFRVVRTYMCSPLDVRNIIVKSGDYILYKICCSVKNQLSDKYKQQDRWTYFVDYDDLDIEDLNLFLIEVCARSFGDYKDRIYDKLPDDIEPYEFIFLREPYSLATSLYSYLNSKQSNHEPTSVGFDFNNFEHYLNSPRLQCSWLIHSLLNITDTSIITEEHFKQTCAILDNMLVCNLSEVDLVVKRVFKDCYNLDDIKLNNVDESRIRTNKNENKKDIPFESLSEKTKERFNNQTKWDYKIYNRYKNANIS